MMESKDYIRIQRVKAKEITFLVLTEMETGKDYRLIVKSVFGSEIQTGGLEATLQGG